MFKKLKSLFTKEEIVLGIRKGILSKDDKEKLLRGETFEFNGTSNDFVLLPKPTKIKEL